MGISFRPLTVFTALLFAGFLASSEDVHARINPAKRGPFDVESREYRFDAEIDPHIHFEATEVWARVFFPRSLSGGPYPVIGLLHGNHYTCRSLTYPGKRDSLDYTFTGKCPEGSVVLPNHEGYNYVAEHLASHGYIVFSVNANRGITGGNGEERDWGLNLARGRLLLKHLALWKTWNTVGGAPESLGKGPQGFVGKVDLSHVGLMGHSRGGEGARAALEELTDSMSPWPARVKGLNIEGIFEIAAVDGQTDRVLDAPRAAWVQLIPACDQDVFDFAGVNPFNRMLTRRSESLSAQKSVVIVYGANHNFFNEEWKSSDSSGCLHHSPIFSPDEPGSSRQRDIGLSLMSHFFLGNVGASKAPELNQIFNPLEPLPQELSSVTRIDREYAVSPAETAQSVLSDFHPEESTTREASEGVMLENGKAFSNTLSYLRAGWDANFGGKLQVRWAAPHDLSLSRTLDLRFTPDTGDVLPADLDFEVSLIDSTGARSSSVKLTDVLQLPRRFNPAVTMLFETARFPVKWFKGVKLSSIQAVRFDFAAGPVTRVGLASLRFTNFYASADAINGTVTEPAMEVRRSAPNGFLARLNSSTISARPTPARTRFVRGSGTRVVSLREADAGGRLDSTAFSSRHAELSLASETRFPVRDALPVLRIGKSEFKRGGITTDGGQITFKIPASAREKFRGRTLPVEILYSGDSRQVWDFGLHRF